MQQNYLQKGKTFSLKLPWMIYQYTFTFLTKKINKNNTEKRNAHFRDNYSFI